MKILVLDNYDSFVYNLVHMLHEVGAEDIQVIKNNRISLAEVQVFDKILLSPGPGVPKDAGIMPEIIQTYASEKSILGVCLGHQAIAEAFGAELQNLSQPLHGVSSMVQIHDNEDYFFKGCPQTFPIGHYHSWVSVAPDHDSELLVTAVDESGNVMALRHRSYDVHGVQFHPESVLTENGKIMLKNWFEYQNPR